MKSFLLELRTVAAGEPDVLRRKLIRDAADGLQAALEALSRMPTDDTMRQVNGAWVNARRQFLLATPPNGGGCGGRMRQAA